MKNKKEELLIFGKKPVQEIFEENPRNIEQIIFIEQQGGLSQDLKEFKKEVEKKGVKTGYIQQHQAETILGKVNFQGVLASIKKYEYRKYNDWLNQDLDKKNSNIVLILDKISDVGNFGALIRTAVAVGVSAIFVAEHEQAPVNATVFKTSAGTVAKIKIVRDLNLNRVIEDLQKNDFWVYGIDMEDQREYPSGNIFEQNFSGNTAIVLGSEGKGISEKILEKCDFVTPIPMENGVESLNVSVAGAVAMYE
jgi:23S rRNA (guanosine2251-2'-O)-methyltransferase